MTKKEPEHGTYARLIQHRKAGDTGEEIDEECLRAGREYQAVRRELAGAGGKAVAARSQKIRHRAMRRLAEMHPVDYMLLQMDEGRRLDEEEAADAAS